jgi:hypothetical protein
MVWRISQLMFTDLRDRSFDRRSRGCVASMSVALTEGG